jgi:hypothetical protein
MYEYEFILGYALGSNGYSHVLLGTVLGHGMFQNCSSRREILGVIKAMLSFKLVFNNQLGQHCSLLSFSTLSI